MILRKKPYQDIQRIPLIHDLTIYLLQWLMISISDLMMLIRLSKNILTITKIELRPIYVQTNKYDFQAIMYPTIFTTISKKLHNGDWTRRVSVKTIKRVTQQPYAPLFTSFSKLICCNSRKQPYIMWPNTGILLRVFALRLTKPIGNHSSDYCFEKG